jgi:hypothetical protein
MLLPPDADGRVRYYKDLLALLLVALTGTGSVQAMWAKMTDAELVESSQLIVMATYRGEADAGLKVEGDLLVC